MSWLIVEYVLLPEAEGSRAVVYRAFWGIPRTSRGIRFDNVSTVGKELLFYYSNNVRVHTERMKIFEPCHENLYLRDMREQ